MSYKKFIEERIKNPEASKEIQATRGFVQDLRPLVKLWKNLHTIGEGGLAEGYMALGDINSLGIPSFVTVFRIQHHNLILKANYKNALAYYQKAAKLSRAGKMIYAEMLLANYDFNSQEHEDAKTIIEKTISELQTSSLPEDQFMLGKLFYEGRWILQNYSKALHYFRKAASAGVIDAQVYIGLCYLEGRGIKKDVSKAIGIFSDNISKSSKAQVAMGRCFLNGVGVRMNQNKASAIFSSAAKHLDPDAFYYLGRCFSEGLGVEKSNVSSVYLSEAIKLNHPQALSYSTYKYVDPYMWHDRSEWIWGGTIARENYLKLLKKIAALNIEIPEAYLALAYYYLNRIGYITHYVDVELKPKRNVEADLAFQFFLRWFNMGRHDLGALHRFAQCSKGGVGCSPNPVLTKRIVRAIKIATRNKELNEQQYQKQLKQQKKHPRPKGIILP